MPGGRPAKYWSNEDMQLLVDLRDGDMKLFREIQEGHFPRRSLQAIRRRYYTAKDLGFRTSRVGARPEVSNHGPLGQLVSECEILIYLARSNRDLAASLTRRQLSHDQDLAANPRHHQQKHKCQDRTQIQR